MYEKDIEFMGCTVIPGNVYVLSGCHCDLTHPL